MWMTPLLRKVLMPPTSGRDRRKVVSAFTSPATLKSTARHSVGVLAEDAIAGAAIAGSACVADAAAAAATGAVTGGATAGTDTGASGSATAGRFAIVPDVWGPSGIGRAA